MLRWHSDRLHGFTDGYNGLQATFSGGRRRLDAGMVSRRNIIAGSRQRRGAGVVTWWNTTDGCKRGTTSNRRRPRRSGYHLSNIPPSPASPEWIPVQVLWTPPGACESGVR